jgi:hypothetical protein
MNAHVIELAIEALEKRKAAVEAEVAQIGASISARRGRTTEALRDVVRRVPRTAAQKKAQSRRMKEYWARKKAEAAKKKG